MIKIEIPGSPISLDRPRASIVKGRISIYDSQTSEKKVTRTFIRKALESFSHENYTKSLDDYSTFSVNIVFKFYTPSAYLYHPSWNLLKLHSDKPDIDNLVKYVLDCGNEILWRDDKSIDTLYAKKEWSKKSCTEISIMPNKKTEIGENTNMVLSLFTKDEILNLCYSADNLLKNRGSSPEEDAAKMSDTIINIANKYGERLQKIHKKMKNI